MKIIALMMCLFLGGCASLSTNEAVKIVINQCPTLKQYTKEQMMAAASELKKLPSEAELAVFLNDYSKLRDACRVAERKLKAISKKKPQQKVTPKYERNDRYRGDVKSTPYGFPN